MPCKIFKNKIRIMGVVFPIKPNQNLRVFWTLVKLQDCVWENHYQIIMKTILQEEETIHYSIKNWFTNFSNASSHENSRSKSSSGQGMGKLEKISAWNLTKVRSKKEVIDEARTKGAKVHSASLMDICHLKNAEFEAKHQKYKCRVVLRGENVKDDSGSYAVFTEQGSSASQMTAAKVMDVISRLLGCAGQAADAVSAYTQVKTEDAPKLLKIPKSERPDIGFVYHDTNCPNQGPVSTTQSFLLSEICSVILWQDCYGKGNLRKSY